MPADIAITPPRQAQPGPILEFWRSFRENRGAVVGLVIVTLICLVALFAPLLAPHSPIEQFRGFAKLPPAWVAGGDPRFLLGTDPLGRDMLSRIIYGARISLFIGLSVMIVSAVVGVALGLVAAAFGGILDVVILHPRRFLSWIPLAVRVLSKHRRTDDTINRLTGRTVSVRASTDTPRQLDGDSIGVGREMHAECIHGKLQVRVPR